MCVFSSPLSAAQVTCRTGRYLVLLNQNILHTKNPKQRESFLPASWLCIGDTSSASKWNRTSLNPGAGKMENPQSLGWHSPSHSMPGSWAANAVSDTTETFASTYALGYCSYRAREAHTACCVHQETSCPIPCCAVQDIDNKAPAVKSQKTQLLQLNCSSRI